VKRYLLLAKNEFRLYQAERGSIFAFVMALALMAIFRFALPNEAAFEKGSEVFPVVAFFFASLQSLLMSISWESEGYAFRYYAMNGTSLSTLYAAKTTVAALVAIPLWFFCIFAYYLFFAVPAPANFSAIFLTALPLAAALASIGQLVAAIAQHSRQKNFLAIALFLPLALPVLIAASARMSALSEGLETMRYDALLVASALIFLGTGNLVYAYLFEE